MTRDELPAVAADNTEAVAQSIVVFVTANGFTNTSIDGVKAILDAAIATKPPKTVAPAPAPVEAAPAEVTAPDAV